MQSLNPSQGLDVESFVLARFRARECSFDRFPLAADTFVPETQLNDPERSDDEMSIVEDLAIQFPGAPVARAVSDDLNALEQLLDVVFIARDGSSARSASQRACYEAVST